LVFAAPASARPPERFTDTESGSEVLAHCDGYDLILTGTTTHYTTVFFDKSGLDVRSIVRTRGTETLTNSVPARVINRAVFTDFFRRIDGTDQFKHTVSGFDFHGQVEGIGPVPGRRQEDPRP
jgi:hypothetical protein